MERLVTGRIVHVNLPIASQYITCRAGIITQVWSDNTVNIFVFPDGINGLGRLLTSVMYLEQPNITPYSTWHWPERV